MNWKDIEPKTTELRNKLLNTLAKVRQKSASKNIPDVTPSLVVANEMLTNPAYDIVVCGEVKKVKSTFINAIIGQELLPAGVRETTSQVFRISNNDKESFYLVFTDGSKEPISREELSRYGSQVDADIMGEPVFKNHQLDYIQINIPIEFLPLEVSIVDTPGLGALYKSHEEITNRYIANAAVVVFVFDPSQPLVKQEKEFLEKVFNITPFVMFIMTKVDCYDEANWVFQISRTETLLKESFEKKCYCLPKVYPVASTTLFDASKEKDGDIKEELIEVSYFPEAYAELLKIMYITVGLSSSERFQTFKSKYFDASLIGTLGSVALSFAGVALAPLTILIGVITYGFLGGRSKAERREMEKNKGNLKSGLANMMNEINAQLFHVPISLSNKSMLQKFTSELASAVEAAMTSMYETQKKQLESEQKELDEQARLGAEQKHKELISLNGQLKIWNEISTDMTEEEKLISYIQKELA